MGKLRGVRIKDCQREVMFENKVLYYKRLRDYTVTCMSWRGEMKYSDFQTHECKFIKLCNEHLSIAEEMIQKSDEQYLVSSHSPFLFYYHRSNDTFEEI